MTMAETFAAELELEGSKTRKLLEVVPFDRADYAPHAKSMPLGRLAGHIAESVGWMDTILDHAVYNMDPAEYKPCDPTSPEELLATFDANIANSRALLQGRDDALFAENWKMEVGGQAVFEMPKGAVIRNFTLNHLVHHRAQLGVYLRMLDIALPQVYGPTADVPM